VKRACLHQVLVSFDSQNASVSSEHSCLLSFVVDSVPQMIPYTFLCHRCGRHLAR
jgi:hypothetical protein